MKMTKSEFKPAECFNLWENIRASTKDVIETLASTIAEMHYDIKGPTLNFSKWGIQFIQDSIV